MMTAQEIVLSFIVSLTLALRALESKFEGESRDEPTTPLLARVRRGESGRSGRIEGVGTYQLHGWGCRLELDSGEEVDFDWDQDGRAIFDEWRLRDYAESLGLSDVNGGDLAEACRALARQGLLEETEGHFRVRA